MFTTGTKFLIGSTVVATPRRDRLRHHPGRHHGHDRARSRPRSPCAFLAGVNIYTRDSNVLGRRPTSRRATRRPPGRPGHTASGRSRSPSAPSRSSVGLVTYQADLRSSASSLLLAGGAEWMAAGVGASGHRPTAGHNAEVRSRIANPFEFPIAGCDRHRRRRLLVQPHDALAVEDQHGDRVRRAGARSSSPSPSSSPTARPIKHRGGRQRRRDRCDRVSIAGGAAAGHQRRARDRTARDHVGPHRGRRRHLRRAPRRPKPTRTRRSRWPPRQRRRHDHAGRRRQLTYDAQRAEPAGGSDTASRCPRSSPNNVVFINESDEHRRLSADLGTDGRPGRRHGRRSAPRPGLHHARRRRTARRLITLNIAAAELRVPRRLPVLRARCRDRPNWSWSCRE